MCRRCMDTMRMRESEDFRGRVEWEILIRNEVGDSWDERMGSFMDRSGVDGVTNTKEGRKEGVRCGWDEMGEGIDWSAGGYYILLFGDVGLLVYDEPSFSGYELNTFHHLSQLANIHTNVKPPSPNHNSSHLDPLSKDPAAQTSQPPYQKSPHDHASRHIIHQSRYNKRVSHTLHPFLPCCDHT